MCKVSEMALNKYGTIEVKRGNKSSRTKLFCPFRKYKDPKSGRDEAAFCSHECGLFPEPQFEDGTVTIKLCQQTFVCDKNNFYDLRDEE